MSDGAFTPYQQTLRIVEHSGDRASWSEKLQTRKHPVSHPGSSLLLVERKKEREGERDNSTESC